MAERQIPAGDPRLHTVDEIAERFQISRRAVYLLLEAGFLGHYRVGVRRIRISEAQVEKFLETSRAGAA